ncbi:hypothetical protein AB0C50_08705 [Micromonospora taraxaci]|nr:hypothetical protein [Micromonospora taraxaci]
MTSWLVRDAGDPSPARADLFSCDRRIEPPVTDWSFPVRPHLPVERLA